MLCNYGALLGGRGFVSTYDGECNHCSLGHKQRQPARQLCGLVARIFLGVSVKFLVKVQDLRFRVLE